MTFQVTIMFGLRFVRFLATISNIVGLFLLLGLIGILDFWILCWHNAALAKH